MKRFALPFFFGLSVFMPVFSQGLPTIDPESVGLSSQQLKLMTTTVQTFVDQGKLAGVTTMVVRKGKVAHFETYGFRNKESAQPMTQDTIFRIYSMTKPITSVAVMLLHEQGKLQLDDPVSKYMPELKDLKVYVSGAGKDIVVESPNREMTVRHLLNHTSGLIYGWGDSPVDRMYGSLMGRNQSLSEMMAKFKHIPLRYHPGEKWAYGVSTDLLGYLVEVLSGMRLDQFLNQHIFTPLGMKDTAFYVPEEKIERLATIYEKDQDGIKAGEPVNFDHVTKSPKFLSGGGGLYSTASDYIRFAQMLLNRGELDGMRVLTVETVESMIKNHISPEVDFEQGRIYMLEGFGLGFGIWPLNLKGWAGIANTYFFINFETETISMLWTQLRPSEAYPMLIFGFTQLVGQAVIE